MATSLTPIIAVSSGGGVTSFDGRTGAVVPTSGDYTVGQVTGAAPLASPALTGNPTAPTQAASDNSTKLATTAFVKAAVPADTSAQYTAAGTYTYNIPANLNYLILYLMGSGAGGGGGRGGAAGEASVGGGSGATATSQGPLIIPGSVFVAKGDAQLTIVVGAGGLGGAGGTNANGQNGGTGNFSSVIGTQSSFIYAQTENSTNDGGIPSGGAGGQAGAGGGGGSGRAPLNGSGPGLPIAGNGGAAASATGGAGNSGNSSSSTVFNWGAAATGGAGGGVTSGNVANNGGRSGLVGFQAFTTGVGQPFNPGGVAPGGNGTVGTSSAVPVGMPIGGCGGGGGAGNAAGNGGNGGNGGYPGGSGGGGGASHGGTGGSGGNGADGYVGIFAS